jgi:hypothetical protein
MVEFSLSFVTTAYMIPMSLYASYEGKSQEKVYEDLEKGILKGVAVSYNPHLTKANNYTP